MASILSAPDDILLSIFEWCLPSESSHFRALIAYDSLDDEALWTLSHVCRAWRTLVVASPRLWSVVSLQFIGYPTFKLRMGTLQVRLALQLSRSKDVPLVVLLRHEPDHRIANYLLPMLAPTTSRWSSLHIVGETRTAHDFEGCDFSNLRHLHMWTDFYPSLDPDQVPTTTIRTFRNTPRIASLSITTLLRYSLELPWEQITTLDVGNEGILDIVKAVNVEELHIGDMRPDQSTATRIMSQLPTFIPCVLKSLRRLYFHNENEYGNLVGSSEFLSIVETPNLEELHILLSDRHIALPAPSPALSGIKVLSIRRPAPFPISISGDYPFLDFLGQVKSVERLTLSIAIVTERVLKAFVVDGSKKDILPRLKTLFVDPIVLRGLPGTVRTIKESRRDVLGIDLDVRTS